MHVYTATTASNAAFSVECVDPSLVPVDSFTEGSKVPLNLFFEKL